MLSTLPIALAATVVSFLSFATPVVQAQAAACNGHAEYCSRLYSNVSVVGAHDSPNVRAGSLAANQNYDVTTQLNNGIRMLQGQGHNLNGVIHLCHTTCDLLDDGPLVSYLTSVKNWLDANPNEVITLLFVNSDNLPVSTWGQAYVSSGLATYSYVPTSTPVAYSAWPTLQSMITSGKRAVTFLASGADTSSVPYILDEFTHMWETPFDETNNAFPCTVDRVTGTSANKMYTINHFLDVNLTLGTTVIQIPATSALNTTNAASGTGSLGLQAQQCGAQHGQYPTFMLVDYYDVGNGSVFQVAAQLNGVTYTPVQIGNGSSTTTPTGSGSGSGSGSSPSSSAGKNSASKALATDVQVVLLLVSGMSFVVGALGVSFA